MSVLSAIFIAESNTEFRNPVQLIAALIFSALTLIMLSFAMPTGLARRPELAAAAFYIALFFGAMLSQGVRTERDRNAGTVEALSIAPVNGSVVFTAKLITATLYNLLLQTLLLPMMILFFAQEISSWIIPFYFTALCVNLSLSALMVIMESSGRSTNIKSIAMPLLVLPLALPCLISGVGAGSHLISGDNSGAFIKVIFAAAILYTMIGSLLYSKISGKQ